jgi:hypothetical protein
VLADMGLASAHDPEYEMETSTLNGANETRAHGIVPLSMKEIEMVAGGKAASSTTSAWDKFMSWLDGWLSGGSSSATPQTTPISPPSDDAVLRMMELCLQSGGTFEYYVSTGGGAAQLAIVRADGVGTTVRISCTN